MIRITNLKKSFDQSPVLEIDELILKEGESVGIVGNNGAGKTTLFSLILDLLKPDDGNVEIDGMQVGIGTDWKESVHAYLDETFLIDFLRPFEYLDFIRQMRDEHRTIPEILEEYADFVNEDIHQNRRLIRDLSTGTKVRVGILSLMFGKAKYLIMDEPFAHLDPTSQARLRKLIKKLQGAGKGVIVSSHNLQNISEACDRVVLIEQGRITSDERVDEGSMQKLSTYFEA